MTNKPNKFRNWLTTRVLWLSGSLSTWAYIRMAEDRDWSPTTVKHVVQSEQNAVWDQVRKVIEYQAGEVELLEDRLSRRFDIGMAMNEAANRAIAQKQAARDPELTGRQKLALEFQKEYLQKVVDKS